MKKMYIKQYLQPHIIREHFLLINQLIKIFKIDNIYTFIPLYFCIYNTILDFRFPIEVKNLLI